MSKWLAHWHRPHSLIHSHCLKYSNALDHPYCASCVSSSLPSSLCIGINLYGEQWTEQNTIERFNENNSKKVNKTRNDSDYTTHMYTAPRIHMHNSYIFFCPQLVFHSFIHSSIHSCFFFSCVLSSFESLTLWLSWSWSYRRSDFHDLTHQCGEKTRCCVAKDLEWFVRSAFSYNHSFELNTEYLNNSNEKYPAKHFKNIFDYIIQSCCFLHVHLFLFIAAQQLNHISIIYEL